MSDTGSNGSRVTLREVYALIEAKDAKWDARFAALDEKFVWRDGCKERHKYLDPRVLWAVAFLLPVIAAVIGGAIGRALIR
jgi:hypothetical protein